MECNVQAWRSSCVCGIVVCKLLLGKWFSWSVCLVRGGLWLNVSSNLNALMHLFWSYTGDELWQEGSLIRMV